MLVTNNWAFAHSAGPAFALYGRGAPFVIQAATAAARFCNATYCKFLANIGLRWTRRWATFLMGARAVRPVSSFYGE